MIKYDIHTVTDFSRKPAEHIKPFKKRKCPEILTDNGKTSVAVQLADYPESIVDIHQALSEKGRPLKEFMAEFEERNGITR